MIVKLQGSGCLVNNQKSVPNDPRNTDYQAVQRWLIGHTDEWLALKAEHDKAQAEHDNWLKIQSYEQDVIDSNESFRLWEEWKLTDRTTPEPDVIYVPEKPEGYYTQEEVDASQAKWDEWNNSEPLESESGDSYQYLIDKWANSEPVVLKRPVDIPEPVVPVLPDPVPNTPEPEFSEEELHEQLKQSVRAERDKRLAEADIMLFKAFDTGLDLAPIKQYRQALRDIPEQPNFPQDIVWPVKP